MSTASGETQLLFALPATVNIGPRLKLLAVSAPKRLPELGKTLGRTLKGFQSASKGFEEEFRKAVDTVEAEVSQGSATAIAAAAREASVPVHEIGRVEAGEGVRLLDKDGNSIPLGHSGYTHF